MAVADFLNNSADPVIAQRARLAIKQAIESRLGLRPAAEPLADAIVHGTITRYDTDQPLSVTSTPTSPGAPNTVNVTQRQVELTIDVTVTAQKTGVVLWEGKNQIVQGPYTPGREDDGRQKALDALVKLVIDGLYSKW